MARSSVRNAPAAGRTTRALVSLGLLAGVASLAVPQASAQPADSNDDGTDLFSDPAPKASPPDVAQPDPDARDRASERFRAGQAAFAERRYPIAAEAFEEAQVLAPHHAALWNAARARELAGQKRLAANHYQHYLDTAPRDARGRPDAKQSLEQLGKELGRLDIIAPGAQHISVDGDRVFGAIAYVDPGEHRVVAHFAHGDAEPIIVAAAVGGSTPVRFTAPALAPATPGPLSPPATSGASAPPSDAKPIEERSGWSPLVVLVGGAATLAFAGLGAWSAIDGQEANDAFATHPTEETKQDMNRVNFRTVTVFGAATAAAVLTTIAAVWLVDWGSDEETTSLVVTPGGAALTGRF